MHHILNLIILFFFILGRDIIFVHLVPISFCFNLNTKFKNLKKKREKEKKFPWCSVGMICPILPLIEWVWEKYKRLWNEFEISLRFFFIILGMGSRFVWVWFYHASRWYVILNKNCFNWFFFSFFRILTQNITFHKNKLQIFINFSYFNTI